MKKSTTYSFWVASTFLVGGVFFSWANFFQPNASVIDSSQVVAFNKEKTNQVLFPPKSVVVQDTKKTVSVTKKATQTQVKPQAQPQVQVQAQTPQAQSAQAAAPIVTRTTKTS
ncbi:MAG: hypothetical protein WCG73_01570 [Candidatus Moraniibacteriota bacterium]